jgi:ABC-2 type transport system ATP-binding protein
MLRFDNLCKRYGERTVFHGLHYSASAGCVALNDESGSGKSTLLGILAGEIEADAGEVWLGGHSLRTAPLAAKSALTYVPEDCLTYPLETGREFLERVAAQRQTALGNHSLELADRFGLTPHLEKRFEQMSFAAARAVLIDLFKQLGQDRVVFFTSYDAAFTQACEAKAISFADLATGN